MASVSIERVIEKFKLKNLTPQINVENMEDINISNVPLENIIMEIYKAKDRQQAKSAVEPVG